MFLILSNQNLFILLSCALIFIFSPFIYVYLLFYYIFLMPVTIVSLDFLQPEIQCITLSKTRIKSKVPIFLLY